MSPFLLPALVSAVIAAIHFFVGGREIARPLVRQTALPPVVTLTHYYCWHLVTITLIGIAGAFVCAAFDPGARTLAVFATLFAGLFCLWGLALVLWKRQRHRHMPQWMLFAVLTASGAWALAA
jgi:hypothetical protein